MDGHKLFTVDGGCLRSHWEPARCCTHHIWNVCVCVGGGGAVTDSPVISCLISFARCVDTLQRRTLSLPSDAPSPPSTHETSRAIGCRMQTPPPLISQPLHFPGKGHYMLAVLQLFYTSTRLLGSLDEERRQSVLPDGGAGRRSRNSHKHGACRVMRSCDQKWRRAKTGCKCSLENTTLPFNMRCCPKKNKKQATLYFSKALEERRHQAPPDLGTQLNPSRVSAHHQHMIYE